MEGLINPPHPVEILRQKKLIELLGIPYNGVSPRYKEKSVGVTLTKFRLLSSGIESVQTLSSGITPIKFSVVIFREWICTTLSSGETTFKIPVVIFR